eukprot:12814515-Heterocapsa_arctica.AAC.1
MAAIANAERRHLRARETEEDRRIRHNRNRPIQTADLISDDEDMPAVAGQGNQPAAAGQGNQIA